MNKRERVVRFILDIFTKNQISKIINFGSSVYKRDGKKFRIGKTENDSDMDFLVILNISDEELLKMKERLQKLGMNFYRFLEFGSEIAVFKFFIIIKSKTGYVKNLDLKIITRESLDKMQKTDRKNWIGGSPFPMLQNAEKFGVNIF